MNAVWICRARRGKRAKARNPKGETLSVQYTYGVMTTLDAEKAPLSMSTTSGGRLSDNAPLEALPGRYEVRSELRPS